MVLVIVKIFDNAFDAHLIKGKLRSEDIESFLFDENMVSMNPLFNITVGGIKLKVETSDYEKAMEIINSSQDIPLTDENEQQIKCPNCSSTDLYSDFKSVKSIKGILSTIVSFLFMSYPLFFNRVYKCKKCDEEFKAK